MEGAVGRAQTQCEVQGPSHAQPGGCGVKDMWKISPGHSTRNEENKARSWKGSEKCVCRQAFAKNGLFRLRERGKLQPLDKVVFLCLHIPVWLSQFAPRFAALLLVLGGAVQPQQWILPVELTADVSSPELISWC